MKRAATIVAVGLVAFVICLSGCASNNNVTTPKPERAAEINLELGVEHLRKGNLQQAKEKIDRALEQNPRYGRAHLVAGMLYNRLGDERSAETHYERAISLEPKNPEFKNNYAVYLCQHKKFERGQKIALEAAADQLVQPAAQPAEEQQRDEDDDQPSDHEITFTGGASCRLRRSRRHRSRSPWRSR